MKQGKKNIKEKKEYWTNQPKVLNWGTNDQAQILLNEPNSLHLNPSCAQKTNSSLAIDSTKHPKSQEQICCFFLTLNFLNEVVMKWKSLQIFIKF